MNGAGVRTQASTHPQSYHSREICCVRRSCASLRSHRSSTFTNMQSIIDPAQVARSLTEFWSPRVLASVDDYYVKVAKLQGTFDWHAHDAEDELFMVLAGQLTIKMEHASVTLSPGEIFVVPKGVRHCPVAEQECHVLLFERNTTKHTGNELTERTRTIAEQLRPIA